MNRNVILLTQFSQVGLLTDQFFTAMPIGHGFSFFGHEKVVEKSWKISIEKEGAPCPISSGHFPPFYYNSYH